MNPLVQTLVVVGLVVVAAGWVVVRLRGVLAGKPAGGCGSCASCGCHKEDTEQATSASQAASGLVTLELPQDSTAT